jgi:hypothetical protein
MSRDISISFGGLCAIQTMFHSQACLLSVFGLSFAQLHNSIPVANMHMFWNSLLFISIPLLFELWFAWL